jgi:hypothetical protein
MEESALSRARVAGDHEAGLAGIRHRFLDGAALEADVASPALLAPALDAQGVELHPELRVVALAASIS